MAPLIDTLRLTAEDVSGLLERQAGIHGPVPAAADEHNRPVHARDFLHLADEMRIDFPIGAVVPRDVLRADRMTHEKIFHLAAAVDEHRLRIGVEQVLRFLGLQMFHHMKD